MTPTAAPAAALTPSPDLEVGGRPLAEYRPLRDNGHYAHEAPLSDVVGYVVRRTIADTGAVLWHDEERTACGYDVLAFGDAALYGQALGVALMIRTGKGFAVVDRLYGCGCRS